MIEQIKTELKILANPSKIPVYQNFFKTGKGQYGEGDIFIGVTVPNTRKIAVKYKDAPLKLVKKLIESKIHEERLLGVLILVQKYQKTKDNKIFQFYKKYNKKINNWDLVDLSADKIVGDYYFHNKDKIKDLYKLTKSDNLWERRTAIVSTFYFIKNNEFEPTISIAEILLDDKHDLIHKAVGWMLREIGKRDKKALENFLKEHYKKMPRTTLRYAIERFPENEKKIYLKSKT
ncbi:DNA alkylation repair protein [Candidatus Pacearchaeota archaeon CG_4_10_14_0_2_um_filter_05_32_18]|nr:MAG: DNA alkylation repair protein [Candidatus Pacearchaeota archaeon CG_4_10_14_0_2_um_filter_05_32_18]